MICGRPAAPDVLNGERAGADAFVEEFIEVLCQNEAMHEMVVIATAPDLVVVAGTFGNQNFFEMVVVEPKQAFGSRPGQTFQGWSEFVVFDGDQVWLRNEDSMRWR